MTDVPQRWGKYEVVRRLAQGGMADIFLAKQIGPSGFERPVVLKCVRGDLVAEGPGAAMFLDEARISARLSHPNLVQVFDFGEEAGAHFLAMEYLVGEDVRQVLNELRSRKQPMPWTVAALIATAACEGLHYAHTLRDDSGRFLAIVHRDISPSNVFVTYQGVVKVLDFGIAKGAMRRSETQAGKLVGKLLYMSPEQVEGKRLDGRSDVFSLGVLLHEMLTGTRLFQRPTQAETLFALQRGPIPSPAELRPDCPESLCRVVLRALEREPSRRYADAAAMARDLQAVTVPLGLRPAHVELAEFLRGLFGTAREREQSIFTVAGPDELTTLMTEGARPGALLPVQAPRAALESAPGWEPRPEPEPEPEGGRVPTATADVPPDKRPLLGRRVAAAAALLGALALGVGVWHPWTRTLPAPAETKATLPPFWIDAQPPGDVEVAGVSRGPAPVRVSGMAPGPLDVVVTNPSLGYRKRTTLQLTRGMSERLEIDGARGALDIRVNPYAEVAVDGRKVGITPFPPIPLYEGTHDVTLSQPPSRRAVHLTAVISPHSTLTLKYRWEDVP